MNKQEKLSSPCREIPVFMIAPSLIILKSITSLKVKRLHTTGIKFQLKFKLMNRKADFTARIVPLEEVYSLAQQVALEIMKRGKNFDLVVAIARGGMLPGRLICDFLNIEQLTSLQIRHYTPGAKQLKKAEILDPVRTSLDGKNVLLIDDVNDSGKTLHEAVKHISSKNPKSISTAVIHEKQNDLFRADFVGNRLKEWKWLIYQWAATEDVLEFLHKDRMLDQSGEKARSYLAEEYGLHIGEQLFRQILEFKTNYY